jgi:hypothetical protein
MTRVFKQVWIAGLVLFAGGLASANEQARLFPLERAAAGMVFFPYPAVVSTAGVRTIRSVHARFSYGDAAKRTDIASLSGPGSGLGANSNSAVRQYPQTLPSYSFGSEGKPHDDFAGDDDDWHFQANPQLGVNHEHEKGLTFLMRRGF